MSEANQWDELLFIFGGITIATMIIPVMVAIVFRNTWNKPLSVSFLYCLITFILNVLEYIFVWLVNNYTPIFQPFLDYWKIDNTNFFLIFYYLKNFLLIGWFYSLIFPLKIFNKYIKYISSFLAITVFVNYLFVVGYQRISFLNSSSNALFIVLLPLIYLWFSSKYSLHIPLRKNPYFWISIGLIIPNLLGFFVYTSEGYIYEHNFILYCQLYSLKNAFEIIGQILIAKIYKYAFLL